jgi:uncharacterized protein YndB with AHSA1/START domain
MATIETAQIGRCELEIELPASVERAWTALTEDIDRWWLPDFRVAGESSIVRLELRAGGLLVERAPDGAELVWYRVQMVRPKASLHLIGHIAADWGGPALSMLKLRLASAPDGCMLSVDDSLLGRVSATQLDAIENGWRKLFEGGLGAYLASAG